MELIERARVLNNLQAKYDGVAQGEGHSVLVSGESGIGKTSFVKAFCNGLKPGARAYLGTCDALFSPRPLAPIYDILRQMKEKVTEKKGKQEGRNELFNIFLQELALLEGTTLIVIEDIHWADEATLDFIKYFARRITQFHCLLVLTYRDNEINSRHPLRNVFGQLSPDSFTRMPLAPLSMDAVEKMALEKGYKGVDVYRITGGNPFYVNEILASYSLGVPDNIKDSILSTYNRTSEKARQVWQILSVIPHGLEIKYLEKMEPAYRDAIQMCLDCQVLYLEKEKVFFKHELYRRTIENALSPFLRKELNKNILDLFMEDFEEDGEIERIIHHAKNANEVDVVVAYAPVAGKMASSLGAHKEAATLFLSAIEYYQGKDADKLIQLYESYAYECYLTNQNKESIIYTGKSLSLLKQKKDLEKTGASLCFLSRLWWVEGNLEKAELFASEAIDLLKGESNSKAKARAYSNMSQLKMLSDQADDCRVYGEKAIRMSREIFDEEILCHALNNVGTMLMRSRSAYAEGKNMLEQSLELALTNAYQDHIGRAYLNLGSCAVVMNDFAYAGDVLEKGIAYCEKRNIGLARSFILTEKAIMKFATGDWPVALQIAEYLVRDSEISSLPRADALWLMARIQMRRGELNVIHLLHEARDIVFKVMQLQSIIPVAVTILEYEWITGKKVLSDKELAIIYPLIKKSGNLYANNEFAFWHQQAGRGKVKLLEYFEGFQASDEKESRKAAAVWNQLGRPYEEAMLLYGGNEDDKKAAIKIVHKLGAETIYDKMKAEMRESGIKSIPRGIRVSTMSNPAHLTQRELDVLQLLKEGLQNKEIAARLFISPKTVDHHISSILFKLDVNSRTKAVNEALLQEIIK